MPARPHPFRELRGRDHILFAIDDFADAHGGAVYLKDPEGAIIIVSPGLTPEERSSHLAHELVHDEIGVVQPPATDATMERVEHMVEQRTADWLIPGEVLAAFVEERAEMEPITAELVAEEFGVTVDVARTALRRMQDRLLEAELIRSAKPPPPIDWEARARLAEQYLAEQGGGSPVRRPRPAAHPTDGADFA